MEKWKCLVEAIKVEAINKKFGLSEQRCIWHFFEDEQWLQQMIIGQPSSRLQDLVTRWSWNGGLPPLFFYSVFNVSMCFVFGFVIFHLWVSAAMHQQEDYAYMVIPNPISGIVSSVNCLENITDEFAKVWNFCFSPKRQPVWVQNRSYYSLEKPVCRILFIDKGPPTEVVE